MAILQATWDIRMVGSWLGHADIGTRELYIGASRAEKLNIPDVSAPSSIRPGRFPGIADSLTEHDVE